MPSIINDNQGIEAGSAGSEGISLAFGFSKENLLDRMNRRLALFFNDIGMILTVLIVVLTVWHGLGRYLFNAPIPGIIDLTNLGVVVSIFFTMAYTEMQKEHISVTLVTERLSRKVQNILYIFTSSLALILISICTYQTFKYAPSMMNQATTVLLIPKGPFFYFTGFGWLLLAFATMMNILRSIQSFASTKLAAIILIGSIALSIMIMTARPLSGILRDWNQVSVGIVGMVLFMILMLLRQPVSLAMGFGGFFILGLYIGWGPAFNIAASVPFASLYNYTWSTVPMFVLMGYVAKNTELAEAFYFGVRQWIGHLPGGLLHSVIVGNAAFGACSGASLAAGITFCSISLPETRKYGYDDSLTLGCIAGGSVLACLIPPSMLFIIYGAATQVSIGRLFVGGMIPGFLLTFMYMAVIVIIAKVSPQQAPAVPRVPLKAALKATPNMLYLIIVFAVIIGGIYMGIFSPTEAGAFGTATVILIGLIRRKLSWQMMKLSLRATGATMGMIGLLLAVP
jgi:TRAP-type C4-dicarboxylate transport system permease small subunit